MSTKPRLIERARSFAVNAGSLFAVAGAIERGRKPSRTDLERLGIDADQFYNVR